MKTELTNEDFHLVVIEESRASVTVNIPERFRNMRVAVLVSPIPDINKDLRYIGWGMFRHDGTDGWRGMLLEDSDRPDWEVEGDRQWDQREV